jgi:hypothetical protein
MASKKKPLLKVKMKEFVEFMFDTGDGSDGYDLDSDGRAEKQLSTKGVFSLSVFDLMKECGYIPSRAIKDKNKVPKELRDNEEQWGFEVNPNDFRIVYV